MPCLGYISETTRCRKLIFGRDIGRGLYVCNAMVCLDLTFDLAYLMLFYLFTGISIVAILSLLYLSYIFLLESWLLHLWVSFDVD